MDDGGMSGGGMDDMIMTMYFYQSQHVKFLFKDFEVSSNTGYFGVCMISFLIGFVTETLSIMQDRLDQQISSKIREEQRKMRARRCSQGLVFLLRMFFSYLCMLAVMTYNVGILFCTVGGLALAYFILGFSPAEVIVIQNAMYNKPLDQQKKVDSA